MGGHGHLCVCVCVCAREWVCMCEWVCVCVWVSYSFVLALCFSYVSWRLSLGLQWKEPIGKQWAPCSCVSVFVSFVCAVGTHTNTRTHTHTRTGTGRFLLALGIQDPHTLKTHSPFVPSKQLYRKVIKTGELWLQIQPSPLLILFSLSRSSPLHRSGPRCLDHLSHSLCLSVCVFHDDCLSLLVRTLLFSIIQINQI